MNEKIYKVLAFCGRLLFPALSVLYATLGKIWNLPYTEQIPMTINAITVFLNAVLGLDSKKFFGDHEIVKLVDEDYDVGRTE